MPVLDIVLGKPLATSEERGEQVGPAAGIPIFGLDALSSAAYGPEAALTLLIPLGALGVAQIIPITGSILILLVIVFFSYRQTIQAYPGGGGSYTVAKENLGTLPALMAASALLTDYVLTAAVGISAGVGALVSAVPGLQPHTLVICLAILVGITVVNLRGLRDSGLIFMAPTYLFLGCMLVVLALGIFRSIASGGHPVPVEAPPPMPPTVQAISVWLILKAFASGCTAMTGVEAVSNGVKAFREPVIDTARHTLTLIIGFLILLLGGIAYLVNSYGIAATDPGKPGYQSVLSMLVAAVAGKGAFYYVTVGSILVVLSFSANTAFADFPRLCRAIASDCYLPNMFAVRGRRLVFTSGVMVLAVLTALLLTLFNGVTDRLIPLYAVGAFLAFTMSQWGMVHHWRKDGGPNSFRYMLVNGLGAIVTGITIIVVLVAKFAEGAWVTVLLIPGAILLMAAVHRHYSRVNLAISSPAPLALGQIRPPLVVVPIESWNLVSKKALTMALSLSDDVRAIHVRSDDREDTLAEDWQNVAAEPIRAAGHKAPELVILECSYRFRIKPILDYVHEVVASNPGRVVTVVVPQLIEPKWYQYVLHRQRANLLAAWLLVTGGPNISVVGVPWCLGDARENTHR